MSQEDREQIEDLLSAYLDEELDEATRARVDEHLVRSPEARETLEQLRQVASVVGQLPRAKAPEDTGEAVFARLEREQLVGGTEGVPATSATPPGALSFGRLVGAAAVLLVAVLAGYLAIDAVQQSRQTPIQLADAEKDTPKPTEAKPESAAAGARMAEMPDKSVPRARMRSLGYEVAEDAATAKARGAAPAAKDKPEPASLVMDAAKRLGRRAKGAEDEARAKEADKFAGGLRDGRGGYGGGGAGRYGRGRVAGRAPGPSEKIAQTRIARARRGPADEILSLPDDRSRRRGKRGAAPIQLAERLSAGATVDELGTYTLEGEAVQLQLTASDSNEQTQLAGVMREFFARNSIQDARSLGTSVRLDADSAFYLARPGRTEPQRGQTFLVRGTPTQVTRLVDELGRSARRDVKVTLATPAILAEGWDRANLAAQMLKGDRSDRRGPAETKGDERTAALTVSGEERAAVAKAPAQPAPMAKPALAPADTPGAAPARASPLPSSRALAKAEDESAGRGLREAWLSKPHAGKGVSKKAAPVPRAEPVGPPIRAKRRRAAQVAAPPATTTGPVVSKRTPEAPKGPLVVSRLPTRTTRRGKAGAAQTFQMQRAERDAAGRPARTRRPEQVEFARVATSPSQPASRAAHRDALGQISAGIKKEVPTTQQSKWEPTRHDELVTVVITLKTTAPTEAPSAARQAAPP